MSAAKGHGLVQQNTWTGAVAKQSRTCRARVEDRGQAIVRHQSVQAHDAPLRQCSATHAGDVCARCRKVHVAERQNEAVLRTHATTGVSAFGRAAVSARAKPRLTNDEHSETPRQGVSR